MDQDKKRELRQLKREIKRKGGKVRRRQLKQGLIENPEEAHTTEVDFGSFESKTMNGLDRDQTWRLVAEGSRLRWMTPRSWIDRGSFDPNPSLPAALDRRHLGLGRVQDRFDQAFGGIGLEPFDHCDIATAALHCEDGSPFGAPDHVRERGRGFDLHPELGRLIPGVLASEVAGVVVGIPRSSTRPVQASRRVPRTRRTGRHPSRRQSACHRGGGAGRSAETRRGRCGRPRSSPDRHSASRGLLSSVGRADRGTSRGGGSAQ